MYLYTLNAGQQIIWTKDRQKIDFISPGTKISVWTWGTGRQSLAITPPGGSGCFDSISLGWFSVIILRFSTFIMHSLTILWLDGPEESSTVFAAFRQAKPDSRINSLVYPALSRLVLFSFEKFLSLQDEQFRSCKRRGCSSPVYARSYGGRAENENICFYRRDYGRMNGPIVNIVPWSPKSYRIFS